MKIYLLVGFVDWEGGEVLGVFDSLETLKQNITDKMRKNFHNVGYVETEIGKPMNMFDDFEEL